MQKKSAAPLRIFKKGTIVEVKGDQVAGGSTWELYWFRGKVAQVNKKGKRVTYNVKMEDPTRFGQKKLVVKNLEARYVRSGEAQKKVTIGKQKKKEKKKTAYTAAGAEGSVCESWEETLARERAEQQAMGIAVPSPAEEKKIPENAEVDEENKEDDELLGLDKKYRKGVDIRKKIEAIQTDEFHLMDRNTLRYGDAVFKKGDEVKYRTQIYELKRIRMYKERPVLMLENRRDGLRRAEVKDCKVEKSIDEIKAEKEAAERSKRQREVEDEKEHLSIDDSEPVDDEQLNIDDAPDGELKIQEEVEDNKEKEPSAIEIKVPITEEDHSKVLV